MKGKLRILGSNKALALVAVPAMALISIFLYVQLVNGLPSGISVSALCAGKPAGSACWMQMDDQPGCYSWNSRLEVNETVTWSGTCSGGLAEGDGEIKWVYGRDQENSTTATGRFQQGKMDGPWVTRHPNGTVGVGPYVDGKQHGQWVERHADGIVHEGPIVDGKRHGKWSEGLPLGFVQEGPYVNGKRHGRWRVHRSGIKIHEQIWDDGLLDLGESLDLW